MEMRARARCMSASNLKPPANASALQAGLMTSRRECGGGYSRVSRASWHEWLPAGLRMRPWPRTDRQVPLLHHEMHFLDEHYRASCERCQERRSQDDDRDPEQGPPEDGHHNRDCHDKDGQ